MAVRVAINGFGRIGRLAFRQMFDAEGYEVVAIDEVAYVRFASVYRRFADVESFFTELEKLMKDHNS